MQFNRPRNIRRKRRYHEKTTAGKRADVPRFIQKAIAHPGYRLLSCSSPTELAPTFDDIRYRAKGHRCSNDLIAAANAQRG
jgi:hypothetical protein